jgi:hypothetical protein
MPGYIAREFEEIQKRTLPILKKTRKYMFLAFLIIPISIMNLVGLVFHTPWSQEMFISTLIFAVFGALGFAFQKEVRYSVKEVHRITTTYMKERVEKSRVLDVQRQQHYLQLLHTQPKQTSEIFQRFLEEENRSLRY